MPAGDPPPTAARPQTTPPTQTPPRRPLAPGPDFVTSSSGSGAFRALNFELYTKPTGFVRTLSFAGTAVALGVVGYWLWETEVAQKQKSQQQKDRRV